MKYLKSCLPKGNLLDTIISLIFVSFVDEIYILQFQCHQILYFFSPFLYMVLIFFYNFFNL